MNQSALTNSMQLPLQAQDYEDKINNYILNTSRRKDLRKKTKNNNKSEQEKNENQKIVNENSNQN